MTRQGAEVMDIEKRARELLAAEYEKGGILDAVG